MYKTGNSCVDCRHPESPCMPFLAFVHAVPSTRNPCLSHLPDETHQVTTQISPASYSNFFGQPLSLNLSYCICKHHFFPDYKIIPLIIEHLSYCILNNLFMLSILPSRTWAFSFYKEKITCPINFPRNKIWKYILWTIYGKMHVNVIWKIHRGLQTQCGFTSVWASILSIKREW